MERFKHPIESRCPAVRGRGSQLGFALVVVLSVMALLLTLGLSVLLLARGQASGIEPLNHRSVARANARLALNLALASLQEEMGPDQRISASAAILGGGASGSSGAGVEHPDWLGVWDSAPADPARRPNYESGKEGNFRRWMVSTPSANALDAARSQDLASLDSVEFLLSGEAGRVARVPLIPISSGGETNSERVENVGQMDGCYGWHISDNSQLARVGLPVRENEDRASQIAERGAAARCAPEVLPGLEGLPTDALGSQKILTERSLDFFLETGTAGGASRAGVTTRSTSLLSNVSAGGWKKDINTLFEIENPGEFEALGYGVWEGSGAANSRPAYLYGPGVALGARWNLLHSYYNLYKDISLRGGVPEVQPRSNLINWLLADQGVDYGDEAGGFRFPRLAKIHYVFSYETERVPGPGGPYRLNLVTDVFFTLWNPFNVRIRFPAQTCMFIKFSEGIPMKFDWHVNGQRRGTGNLHDIIRSSQNLFIQQNVFNQSSNGLFSMEPGETLVFSSNGSRYDPGISSYDQGIRSPRVLNGQSLHGRSNDRISVSLLPDQHGSSYNNFGRQTSQYCDFWVMDANQGIPIYEHRGEIVASPNAPFLRQMSAVNQADVRAVTFREALGRKQPFGLFSVELRGATDASIPSLAFLHSGYARLSSFISPNLAEFVNERMEYRLDPITSFNSDLIQLSQAGHPGGANHGFIGTGRTAANGLTHLLHQGMPLMPVTSLAEFQHATLGDGASVLRATTWTRDNATPNPPYTSFAVSNSYAHPLIPSDRNRYRNYYDHSYWANAILWDDYFCSSLSNEAQSPFGGRTMSQMWQEFLEGEARLLNPRYRIYRGGQDNEALQTAVTNGGNQPSREAHQRIAANLLYEGGFNVNSTSVPAWEAFLSSGKGQTVPFINAFGANASLSEGQAEGTPFSRTKVPLGPSIDGGAGGMQNQFLGFRDLSRAQIRELAERIVDEVKLRGPFLNLSEFINRRLSSDTRLARSGALQSAIDATSINADVASVGIPCSGGGKRYAFPEAGEGQTTMGAAGWLMQGDLLTPLGPSMFVRGDTFTIRAYGDCRDSAGRILSRAVCEAVVQRYPDFVNPLDDPLTSPPTQVDNQAMGRRFQVLEFRWVNDVVN